MRALRYSAAAVALLMTTGIGYAQSSSNTKVNCPAPGTVAESAIPAECKDMNSGSSATQNTTQDNSTGSTTVPKDDNAAASGTTNSTTTTGASSGAQVTANAGNAILASQFMGQTIYSTADENVGEINDVVMDKKLNNVIAVIGVGGFLGIGEKDVAIPIDQINVAKDSNNNMKLTINATKEQLKAAPAFDRTALR